MTLSPVKMHIPEEANIIVGQSHFIKTVEDLYEALATSGIALKFGIAFCESSQECLVRWDGNDRELIDSAVANAQAIGAGHVFVIVLRGGFPINVLNAIKNCPEVCRVFCATANPLEVIVIEREHGRGVVGVVDGLSPAGVETEKHQQVRREFLRKIGYKR
ncbi:MAG: adenosine monophosphate-protein transferase [Candidatus Glassbacteria bacterium RIFCSPLOWO2_12_FULL_58_11]|uniref:Adenosine monophosphate-protein transferase n=1 Tax=Candidatus Glassbacteria bacterium RIFCSPLOWO2_12_FULL_58_11 TaxID=1817867 RepID=A0A1F5YYU8_9BACT|nr:MAG: adenosine monophosphate-protein transferase [Candidatus Glassbacteria bacterium RIFCSPLOWO2_12_FULL_58_11]